MKRADLEHLLRAAGAISQSERLIIVGSQAILGAFPEAPGELTASEEIDTYPEDAPEKADLIDGSIGEKSLFHETFGYFAHGVGPETAILPEGWRSRLIPVANENTGGVMGLCLHPLDLAISKLAAGRPKDIEFVSVMIRNSMIAISELKPLAETLPQYHRGLVLNRLSRLRN